MTDEQPGQALTSWVWVADISLLRPCHTLLLDETENARRSAYRRADDRARFTVAAALLRLVLAAELRICAAAVPIDRTCTDCGRPHGKPRIVDHDVHVSVSHSGAKVAVGLTYVAPIGLDVEMISSRAVEGLEPFYLTPHEPVQQPEDFFTYWCRKESAVKATGDGMRTPLAEVRVSPANHPARLVSYRGRPLVAAIEDLPVGAGYAGAVSVLAPGDLELVVADAAPLFTG